METNTTDELAKILFSIGAKAAISKIYARFEKKGKLSISQEAFELRLKHQAQMVQYVKTLLSTEHFAPIESFYCPPRVRVGHKPFTPKDTDSFRENHVLIEGIAGQGKSILLRYLCGDAVLNKGKIGFYYELRRLDPLKPLITIVAESLAELGMPGTNESIKLLAMDRDLELYLDGFDEIDEKSAVKIDRDLDFIVRNHPFIRVFITARPHVKLSGNSNLIAHRIEPLDRSDVLRLIDKLCDDKALASDLKTKLANHKGEVQKLLETPLLVTLLVAHYVQTQQIPDQLSDFYESIFLTLFERHDYFKKPFVRSKRLGLTTAQYKKIFQKFCFGSIFLSAMTTDEIVRIAQWASGYDESDSVKFLEDVADVSALISEERGAWSFIHASVQEYYAASYLMAGTDAETQVHSDLLRKVPSESTREQVFRFAAETDSFKFIKLVELPFLESICAPTIASAASEADAIAWLIRHIETIVEDKNSTNDDLFFTIWLDTPDRKQMRMFVPASNKMSVRQVLGLHSNAEIIRSLAKLDVVGERIIKEASDRLNGYLAKFNFQRELVTSEEAEREKAGKYLQDLLKS